MVAATATQCGACSGSGQVEVNTGWFSPKKITCQDCEGTGEISVELSYEKYRLEVEIRAFKKRLSKETKRSNKNCMEMEERLDTLRKEYARLSASHVEFLQKLETMEQTKVLEKELSSNLDLTDPERKEIQGELARLRDEWERWTNRDGNAVRYDLPVPVEEGLRSYEDLNDVKRAIECLEKTLAREEQLSVHKLKRMENRLNRLQKAHKGMSKESIKIRNKKRIQRIEILNKRRTDPIRQQCMEMDEKLNALRKQYPDLSTVNPTVSEAIEALIKDRRKAGERWEKMEKRIHTLERKHQRTRVKDTLEHLEFIEKELKFQEKELKNPDLTDEQREMIEEKLAMLHAKDVQLRQCGALEMAPTPDGTK